jgi:hypothetical protein
MRARIVNIANIARKMEELVVSAPEHRLKHSRKTEGCMRSAIFIVSFLTLSISVFAGPQWQDSTLIKVETINGACEHCGSDVVKTNYSFKLSNGMIYIAQIGSGGVLHHRQPLDVTLNGHIQFRFEKDGHVGDYIRILDDKGKKQRLLIIGKAVPAPSQLRLKAPVP